MILSSEQLNKIWVRWRDQYIGERQDAVYIKRQYSADYSKLKRNYGWPKKFEEWLWEEGAMVQQVNHKRQLYFADESRAIMFALRHV